MGEICYQIKEIPDLTLSKYSFLSQSGVSGVLETHLAFLRQWHEKSILSGVTMHLVYEYKSENNPGQKINIYFIVRGKDVAIDNVDMLVQGASFSDYFKFELVYRLDSTSAPQERKIDVQTEYEYCCALSKEEIFFNGSDGRVYYDVPLWEPNEEGRLYGMFRMMEALNEDVVFRIDLKAIKKNRSLRKSLSSGPIPRLHELQSTRGGDRDYGADSILHDYDALMKALDSTPHFSANVFVFSRNRENGSMVMASAISEAIEEGDYRISSFKGSFRLNSFISDQEREIRLMDLNNQANEFYLEYNQKGLHLYSEQYSTLNYSALSFMTTTFTLEEIAPIFRFPCLFDGETISIRKETVAPLVPEKGALYLGLDENKYEINFPIKLLPKHAFVSGVPGSGKTNTMHHLTHTLWAVHKIPFLVFEPAKKEYRALCNLEGMEEMRLFSPRSNMKFPLHINPFEFPKGLTVSEHISTLCSVFEGAFPLDNPMPFLLDTAIEGVYRDRGWTPETVYTDATKLEFPTMSMLYKRLEEELERTTYSAEVRGNLESALKVRIGSLLRREMGEVFDVEKSSLSPEEWMEKPTVVELEAMGSGPANFLTLMLCSLIRECLKVNPVYTKGPTRHVIFIEEAHNLIGPDSEEKTGEGANAKVAATAFVVKMLAEVRALKEAVFIADQLPTVMAPEVIKNTGLKIALRLTAMDDRQLLCNSMSANSSQIEDMGNFNVGEALISYEGLQRPFKMRIKEWCGEEKDKEKKALLVTPKNDDDLFEHIKDFPSYRDNVRRSLVSVYKKLKYEYSGLEKQFEIYKNRLDQAVDNHHNQMRMQAEYDKLLDEASQILVGYGNDVQLAFESDAEYAEKMKKCAAIGKEISNFEEIILNDTKNGNDSANFIVDLIEFANKVYRKTKHYKEMGITLSDEALKAMTQDPSQLEDWERCYNTMTNGFKYNIFGWMQSLYTRQVVFMPNEKAKAATYNKYANMHRVSDYYKF